MQFLWRLPITDAERALKVSDGLEALESRFGQVGLRYWQVDRPSVVASTGAVAAFLFGAFGGLALARGGLLTVVHVLAREQSCARLGGVRDAVQLRP